MTHPSKLLKQHNLRANKLLGQNFLCDTAVGYSIVESAGIHSHDTVVEIGPGLGALTHFLAARARRVIAVEIDSGIASLLSREFSNYENVEIVNQDFLKFDMIEQQKEHVTPVDVIGNLPYSITSPVLFKLMNHTELVERAVLMVQREVADRILSEPGSRNYGLLSVLIKYYGSVRQIMRVSPKVFYPVPKVESSVIEIDFTQPFPRRVRDGAFFRTVVKASFSMRRKMIKNCLAKSATIKQGNDEIIQALENAGIDPKARAETISLDRFIDLSDEMEGKNNSHIQSPCKTY